MILSIMGEAKENIREAMRLEKSVEKQIIQYLKELKTGKFNAFFNDEGIKRIDMLVFNQQSHRYIVKSSVPKSESHIEQVPKVAGDELNSVIFDITRVRENIEKRKKG